MAILKATESFVGTAGGQRHEVHEGDLLSDSHPTARAYEDNFVPADQEDVVKAVARARGQVA